MKDTHDCSSLRGKVDYGIVTIREDEARAILTRIDFSQKSHGLRTYNIAKVLMSSGQSATVAHLRCPGGQGPSEARETANALIRDLEPQWVIVVGIAGSIPNEEVSLGDVVISSAIYDPRITASNPDGTRSFAFNKEKLHQKALDFVAQLPGLEAELGEWYSEQSISVARPKLPRKVLAGTGNDQIKGTENWQNRVLESLEIHFGRKVLRPSHPVARAVPFLSSSELVKDPAVVERWLIDARDLKAIEMELIGVYEACNAFPIDGNNVPLISIRGISDIVGLKRQPHWTRYACESAAAFTVAVIKTGSLQSANHFQHLFKPTKRGANAKDPAKLLQLGKAAITPKLASGSNVSPFDVFKQLALQTLTKEKVTICWNVRPVPYLGIIHVAYLQQLSRLKEWGFRIRVVLYDVCTSNQYDKAQIATIVSTMSQKIHLFRGLQHPSSVVRISDLLQKKNAADVIASLFSLARPAIGETITPDNDPATSLDNLLCIAVERWNSHHILLAGVRDSNDFWADYRMQLAAAGMRSEFPSLILDFPKLTIGRPITPEDLDTQPNEQDTTEVIAEKLKSITAKEIENFWNIIFLPNDGLPIPLPANATNLASLIHSWFRSSPYQLHQ